MLPAYRVNGYFGHWSIQNNFIPLGASDLLGLRVLFVTRLYTITYKQFQPQCGIWHDDCLIAIHQQRKGFQHWVGVHHVAMTLEGNRLMRDSKKLALAAAAVLGLSLGTGLVPSAAHGNIYVVNGSGMTVGEYTNSGTVVNSVSGFYWPNGVAVSGSNMFVTNGGYDTIGEYTTSGGTVNSALVDGLDNPQGVAISGSTLYVVNSRNPGSIGEYNAGDGTAINTARAWIACHRSDGMGGHVQVC